MSAPAGKRQHNKLAAFVLVAGMAGIVAIAFTMFAGGFTSTVPVTVTADRSGLVMEKDAKVKMRGVVVGHVKDVRQDLGGAVLDLAMDPSKLSMIPSNAKVSIASTTVFGAKTVNFSEPQNPSTDHLQPGATVGASNVTVEFNTLFQNLQSVLTAVQPEKLNATLGAISTALQGQGKPLGETLVKADKYLADMSPSLPALETDIQKAARVSDIYAGAAPDLMKILDNGTTFGNTITDEKDNFNTLLLNVIGLANTGSDLMNSSGQKLVSATSLLTPTTGLVSQYHEVLTCFLDGLSNALPQANKAFGGSQPGLNLTSGFLLGAPAYSYQSNLPKVNAKNAPNCYGLPWVDPGKNAPYVVTDTGVNPTVTKPRLNTPSLWAFLLGPPPPGFSW